MMQNKKFVLLLLLLCLLVGGSAAGYRYLTSRNTDTGISADSAPQKITAPDFTVMSRAGEAVKLSDAFGKPLVVNFWATWCGPCKSELPAFEAAYRSYDDVEFLMVNLTDGSRETVESARDYMDGQGYTLPVYFDTDLSGAVAYAVSSVPSTYFIDENGALVAYGKKALSAEKLQAGIDMLLGK
jgi:thiol-disulfide isomerase/thioredoxin